MRRQQTQPQPAAALTIIGYKVATLDEIAQYAPSAFSSHPSNKVSDRYSFVSTGELLNGFEKLGWKPTHVRQNGSGDYARHMVRLTNDSFGNIDGLKNLDKVRPQIVLDNSHNGGSTAQIHMGLFRLVCTNGLVVAIPGMYTAVKLRHVGIDMEELKQLMEIVSNQYTTVGDHISEMQRHLLTPEQGEEFVIKAMAARESHAFIKEDGTIDYKKVTATVNPVSILEPIRGEDQRNDLWTVFNVVQERLIKGDFERQSRTGRKSSPRAINNAIRNIDLNKKLWTLAESFMVEDAVAEVIA